MHRCQRHLDDAIVFVAIGEPRRPAQQGRHFRSRALFRVPFQRAAAGEHQGDDCRGQVFLKGYSASDGYQGNEVQSPFPVPDRDGGIDQYGREHQGGSAQPHPLRHLAHPGQMQCGARSQGDGSHICLQKIEPVACNHEGVMRVVMNNFRASERPPFSGYDPAGHTAGHIAHP